MNMVISVGLLFFFSMLLVGIGILHMVVREPHKRFGYGLGFGAFVLCVVLWMLIPPTVRITLLTPLIMGVITIVITARIRN